MSLTDIELEQQLKEAGKQLSHPPAAVDELLSLLDQAEKLLSKVDQSPDKSMLDALKPSMKALVEEGLLRHSDVDVKAAVASCISEITRITAPDAPYNDDQMRDVFQLIVSSFVNLSDHSSRSYNKRVSILETVSKVRSCVIMLDLECDMLIAEMFELFLKSVRDHHLESIYPSMENIMVLVLEESEDVPVDMLKPLLACVKNDSEGVLPIARKLAEGVLEKSAAKLKPYLMPTLKSLGDSIDNYSWVVASICEGTTATAVEHNDENVSGPQLADERKSSKGPIDEAQQADDSKLMTASSDGTNQAVKENAEGPCPEEADPTLDTSPKSVMSNGIVATENEEALVDQESSKKPDEVIDQPHLDSTNKEDNDDSDAEKFAKEEPKLEQTSKRRGKKSDTMTTSAEPSDSSHVEDGKEAEKLLDSQRSNSKDVHSSPVKEVSVEAVIPSDTKKDGEIPVSSPKDIANESADVPSPSQSGSLPGDSCVKKSNRSKKKQLLQQDKTDASGAVSPSQSGSLPDESCSKKAGVSKNKSSIQEEVRSVDPSLSKTPEGTSGLDIKPQKQAGKKTSVEKEVNLPAIVGSSEDAAATSDSDAKPMKKPSKKVGSVKSGSKSGKQSSKKAGGGAAKKLKQSGKKVDAVVESEAKKPKQTGKKVDGEGKPSTQSLQEEEESDSDAKPLKLSVKKGEKNKVEAKLSKNTVDKGEKDDSEAKPVKFSAKKGDTSKSAEVKSSSKKKDDGKKHGRGKNAAEKEQARSLSEDDEMDSSPKSAQKSAAKSAAKSAKGENNLKETPATSSKRKRGSGKDKASGEIKYDKSLVGLKVSVYWPEDEMYYEGTIDSFNSAKKKHKVLYVDGDVETLDLSTQDWHILEEFSVREEEQPAEDQAGDASPEIHKKKKSKTDVGSSALQEKGKDSSKRTGKSKGSASKSARNSKGEGKTDKIPQDKTPKDTGGGGKSAPQKSGGKSTAAAAAEETPKPTSKTKPETSKTVNKSKGKTPGNKDNANGSNKAKPVKESTDSTAAKTPEPAKGKSPETAKAAGGSKSGKKRKKRT